ncbi:hypothetical protein HD554DRAFT_2029362 [Boletus coccyginus]|nr:hypothetical protein HD554DRAFT_2029362 [Boletus coccyginus]
MSYAHLIPLRTPTAIVDQEDRIITIMAGRPDCQDWDGVHAQMSALLEQATTDIPHPHKDRRGGFTSLFTGISYGGGQVASLRFASEQAILNTLCEDASFIRAAGFMSSCFGFYSPKLYMRYAHDLKALLERYSHLKKPFDTSVFPTCTFNCGTRVVTLEHVDSGNVPYGLCAIFACGSYDPTLGGHLILFNLGLVIQFPPGSTILVPSGTIRHGNTATQPHEKRQSFTQYCPGGLLRWVAYGFKAVKAATKSVKQHFDETHKERCIYATGLFSKVHELHEDRVRAFGLRSHY